MAALHVENVSLRPLRFSEIGELAGALVETSEAQIANRWREQALGYRELLAAEGEGELGGTGSTSESERPPRSLHLFALEVAPAWRDRGVGGAIVRWVVDEARRRGRHRVYLAVRIDNPARRLYHRLRVRRGGSDFVHARG